MKRWLLLAAALTSGCANPRAPSLPKFATGAGPPSVAAKAPQLEKLHEANVIYLEFAERVAPADRSTCQIVEALREDGEALALGWTQIEAAEQPILERWHGREISTPQLLDQLGAALNQESLRCCLQLDLPQVALGGSPQLLRQLGAGRRLTAEERVLLPRGFRTPPEAIDDFADRASRSRRWRHDDFGRLYRAHLVAEQLIADQIVHYLRTNPKTRLLVLLPNDLMVDPREVARYAAQKMTLRQIILDRAGGTGWRQPLLAHRSGGAIKIVDRAPETVRHHRRLPAPRLRA